MRTYLGDSVYAEVKDGRLVFTTENGDGFPSNTIVFEPETVEALLKLLRALGVRTL